jgi:hypothetical protein
VNALLNRCRGSCFSLLRILEILEDAAGARFLVSAEASLLLRCVLDVCQVESCCAT